VRLPIWFEKNRVVVWEGLGCWLFVVVVLCGGELGVNGHWWSAKS